MLKRTKGRLLITLLVITGLAGTVKHNSLLPQERKFAVRLWKDNKAEILNAVQNLSDKQLHFQSPGSKYSIAYYIENINATEKAAWELFEKTMSQPATAPEMRLSINFSDEQIIEKVKAEQSLTPFTGIHFKATIPREKTSAAITTFKTLRTQHIRYLRSSTEDLRNHILETSAGPVDCYQLALAIASYHQLLAEKIQLIKANPSFPKQ